MITTTVCDEGRHAECPGHGLVRGTSRPPHEPEHPGEKVWVTVDCGCSCHALEGTLEALREARQYVEAWAEEHQPGDGHELLDKIDALLEGR